MSDAFTNARRLLLTQAALAGVVAAGDFPELPCAASAPVGGHSDFCGGILGRGAPSGEEVAGRGNRPRCREESQGR